MDEYISKQRAKDLMGCCLASVKAEYKAAKDEFTKARFGDYISSIQSMIDVIGKVEAADVQLLSVVAEHIKKRLYETAFNTTEAEARNAIADMAERIDFWINELKEGGDGGEP